MIAVILVAPFWVLAYIVGGWAGVVWMAIVGVAGELLLFGHDELGRRRQVQITRGRWERWHG